MLGLSAWLTRCRSTWLALPVLCVLLALGVAPQIQAEEPKPATPPAAAPAPAAPAAPVVEAPKTEVAAPAPKWEINTGNNAWMLVSCALVLMMTAPGLALFYCGLVRQKNVLSTMMHSVFLMGLMSLLWAFYGYSMAFGEGSQFVGNFTAYFMLNGVATDAANSDYATTIPHMTFCLFQMMFAIITPALISGAYAERVKFSSMVVFTIVWATVVYFPLAHMVWGKGGLFNWCFADTCKFPALDFAGGTVVHISSGISALVFAIVLGPRKGYPEKPMVPHSLVLSVVGAAMLWVGWFGFNAGSALMADGIATGAFAATHFAAATAAFTWAGLEWIQRGKPTALGTISGLVAGLVGVTPAAGFVTVGGALAIGAITATTCYLAVTQLKAMLKYDDSLDAFGVHGVGGTTGAILTGVFASSVVNPNIGGPTGLYKVGDKVVNLDGSMSQVMNQAAAAGITIVLAFVATFIILKVIDAVMGLRASEEAEFQGLDLSMHGEEGYVMGGSDHSAVGASSAPSAAVGAVSTAPAAGQ